MYSLVGAASSPWYFEGIAELMATHRLEDGKLTLNYFPRSREDVPGLGRIEIVQTAYAAGREMNLVKILAYDSRAHFQIDPYGWCWQWRPSWTATRVIKPGFVTTCRAR